MKNNIIIIIDDDEDDRSIFCEALKEINSTLTCIEIENGERALLHLNNEKQIIPDYIFLDLNMPKMDGMECLGHIKHIKRLSNVPVIMYSTSSLILDKEVSKNLGASGFISKPYGFNKLCSELKRWIV